MEYYILTNELGHYFRGKKLGWSPFLQEALFIKNLDILSDIVEFNEMFMRIKKVKFEDLGNNKVVMKIEEH